jgi:hypothetical protein
VTGPPSPRISIRRYLILLELAAVLSACGSGGGSGSSNAPTISNLRVSYTPSNPFTGQTIQVGFIVDVLDPNGDWVLGSCRFVTGNILDLPIQTSGVPTNATSGTAACFLNEVFQNETVRIDLVVVDQAGNLSNVLSGLVNLEGRLRP